MDFFAKEMERVLDAGFHYFAIIVALTIPDICAALESEDGTTKGAKYRDWCEEWFLKSYPSVTSHDLYYMRCGVMHQGNLGHPKMQYGRIIFTLPNAQGSKFHNNIIRDALNMDAETFCRDMVQSMSVWYASKKDTKQVVSNLPRLLRTYPNGLHPYMVGMPLIS